MDNAHTILGRYFAPHILGILLVAVSIKYIFTSNRLIPEPTKSAELASTAIETIGLADALAFYHGRSAIFVDARSSLAYTNGHIAGAISVTPSTPLSDGAEVGAIRSAVNVVIYCNRHCVASTIVAQRLRALGTRSLKIYSGGWEEWSSLRQPSEK